MENPKVRQIFREVFINGTALISATVISSVFILILGENPFAVFGTILSGTFGSLSGFSYTLFYTTPLIFTGLAVGIGFKCGFFNIGAEGQLYTGAFAAAWAGFTFSFLPGWILIPFCIFIAMLAGGIWGWIPGYLKGRFGSHEVINTIMMNFIAIGIIGYFVSGPFMDKSTITPQTPLIAEHAQLPLLSEITSPIGIDIPAAVPLNFSFIIALFVSFLVYIYIWKTIPGYELRAAGASRSAAHSSGINIIKVTALTFAISGAIAGLVGVNEVLGYRHRFLMNFSPGYGYTGIAIALMGRNHPFGIILGAFLFGIITRGGLLIDVYYENLSKDIIYVFQGIIILFIAARSLSGFLKNKS
ncbi:ABC transporter permease [candidate division KSB1 bacterium]